MTVRDETTPEGRWAFDAEVTEAFDDMLERSIPQYSVMRKAVTDLATTFVPRGKHLGGLIVDLGCSRGEALAPLVDRLGVHARYVGAEVSEPMLEAARDRFEDDSGVRIVRCDLRTEYPVDAMADVTLAILTLQFTPIERRQTILRRIWEHTRPGGALILVEKVLGETADLDQLLVDRYYALKGENGYGPEQIERKRLSLEGVLVPVTARWNVELLQGAGFVAVDSFWRWMNFAGWVAIR